MVTGREMAGQRSYGVINSRVGGVVELRLRWLQGCGFAWDGVAGYVDESYVECG